MEIAPLRDYVVIEEIVQKAESGIILVEGADVPPTMRGTIVTVGPDVDITVGREVFFKKHMFDEVVVDKKTYLVGRAENIFAFAHA